jgi:hypothetical protein
MSGIFKLFLPDDGYSRNMSGIFKLFLPDEGYSRNMSGIFKLFLLQKQHRTHYVEIQKTHTQAKNLINALQ